MPARPNARARVLWRNYALDVAEVPLVCFANASRHRIACGYVVLNVLHTVIPTLALIRLLLHAVQVWGRSTKHDPMRCGLAHPLDDEDVLQIVPKTITQQASPECGWSDSCRLAGLSHRPFTCFVAYHAHAASAVPCV